MSDIFYDTQVSAYGCAAPSQRGLSVAQRRTTSPYLDFATHQMPKSFMEVIDWSEYVATLNDDLFRGISKLYGYFATDVRFSASESEVKPFDIPSIRKWQIYWRRTSTFSYTSMSWG